VKIVVDTNVVVSGIFFSGPPYHILLLVKSGYGGVQVMKPRDFVEKILS
jgi:hypothetical protein